MLALITSILIAQQSLIVTETFDFSPSLYLAIEQVERDKLPELPIYLKILDDGSCLAQYTDGWYWYPDRYVFELATQVASVPETDPATPETTRGAEIEDLYTTPDPTESAPLNREQTLNTDPWRDPDNRDASTSTLDRSRDASSADSGADAGPRDR